MTCLRLMATLRAGAVANLCVAAAVLASGCTRENPAFLGQGSNESGSAEVETGSEGAETLEAGSEVGESEVGEVGVSSQGEGEGGDGDGDGDGPELPLCSEGSEWIRVDILEDTFVHNWSEQQAECVVDYGDPANQGGDVEYGPGDAPCYDLNYGSRDAHWLATNDAMRTGYLARADLEWLTGRGISVEDAKVELPVAFSGLDGEVLFSLAPIRDDNGDWDGGKGDAEVALDGEATHKYRSHPDTWGGQEVYGIVDISKLVTTQWFTGDPTVAFYLPVARVQSWLDVDGRHDPGFLVWNDVSEPSAFYLGSLESSVAPTMYVKLCYPD